MVRKSEILEIRHRFALLIGVRDYEDDHYRNIPQTVHDVKELDKVLSESGYTVCTLHCDQTESTKKPTKENIWQKLKYIASMTGSGDLLLVHFGGHGDLDNKKKAYLVPSGGSKNTLPDSAIDLDEFKKKIVEAHAQVKILILDACHSGIDNYPDARGMPPDFERHVFPEAKDDAMYMSPDFERHVFLQSKGTGTLASCRRGEVAYEHDQTLHGTFTYFLLEGLKGKAAHKSKRFITFDDLKDYVTNAVRTWAIKRDLQQWPNASTHWIGIGDPPLVELTQPPTPIKPFILKALIAVFVIIAVVLINGLLNNKVLNIKMVHIPAGNFLMGTSAAEIAKLINDQPDLTREMVRDETPQRKIYLDAFYISKYEITNKQYGKFLKDNPQHPKPGNWNLRNFYDPDQPVVGVGWDDAVAFCNWLSKKTAGKYKLPSEAQWEKAARGTDGGMFPWGNSGTNIQIANYNNPYGKPMPVGYYPRGENPVYGTMEMAGNVAEWCNDWYDESYYVNLGNTKNPGGPLTGQKKVVRGGSWIDNAFFLRCTARNCYPPGTKREIIGFRVVRIPKN
jgi:sulfatase modifying factor 1